MASIKLKHTSGNGTILNSPAANPSSDITLKLPSTTGSAGQVLQVASANHSSTNAELEFAAVSVPSGDFVKLQSATATSTVATLDFQSLDVTTYKSFKFVFSLKPEVDGGQVFLRLFDGSTNLGFFYKNDNSNSEFYPFTYSIISKIKYFLLFIIQLNR